EAVAHTLKGLHRTPTAVNTGSRPCREAPVEVFPHGGVMSVVAFKEKSRVLAELWLLVATALFFSSTVSAPALAQTVSFNARLDFAVEAHPTFVAAGDFNGDGVH